MASIHRSVMVREVTELLDATRGGMFVDATFGGGGHTRAILAAHPANRVIAFDRDPAAVAAGPGRLGPAASRVDLIHADYRDLEQLLEGRPRPDGLLADLGVSTDQILNPARGFSFTHDGPLDMRMDPSSTRTTAADLINSLSVADLRRLLREKGEEKEAVRISRALVRRRKQRAFTTTSDLAAVIEQAVPQRGPRRLHPATRTFMALRITVNDELSGLGAFVEQAAEALAPAGRLVVLSFHSLEDRPVKHALRGLAKRCICPPDLPICGCHRVNLVRLLTPRPLRPTAEEVQANPAARSVRLRAALRLAA